MNPMKKIRIEKVTINMGMGQPGPELDNAKKIVEKITGRKAVITKTKKRSTFGVAKGRDIGVKVTLRKAAAEELLKRLLEAKDNILKESSFDESGNFSFGIGEYINIPGVKYDPDVGIMGMDVCVTLERPGYRVKRRSLKRSKVGRKHRITKAEAIEFARKELKVEIEG
jgi:large subunit ribosomal protein L5